MSKKLYEESNIQEIASTIREKKGTQDTYKVSQMAEAMSDLIGPPAYNNMILAQDTQPDSEYNKVWFDTDADDEYTFPEIDDNNVSTTDTWSSQKIKAEDDNLKSALSDVEDVVFSVNRYDPSLQTSDTISPYYWENGAPTASGSEYNCTAPIKIKGGTEYTIGLIPTKYGYVKPWGDASVGVMFFDSGMNYISQRSGNTFTTPSNAKYMRFNYLIGAYIHLNYLKSSCMIVEGSTLPATYTPYISAKLPNVKEQVDDIEDRLDTDEYNEKQFVIPTYSVENLSDYSIWYSPAKYNNHFDVLNNIVVRQFENVSGTNGIAVHGVYEESDAQGFDTLLRTSDTEYHIIQLTRNYHHIQIANNSSVVSPINREFVFEAYKAKDIPKQVIDSVREKNFDNIKSPIKGMKFNCLGDSFTESLNYWGNFIASRSGCTMVNKGKSGSRISTDWQDGSTTIQSFINRVSTLDTTANATIIFGGINDANAIYIGDITLGDISSEPGTTTFYGALKKLINDIRNINVDYWASRRIFGVIPPDFYSDSTRFEIMKSVQQACRDVYELYGIPYADVKKNCQEMYLSDYNINVFRLGSSDHHPSQSGYGRISNVIQGVLEMYYQIDYSS